MSSNQNRFAALSPQGDQPTSTSSKKNKKKGKKSQDGDQEPLIPGNAAYEAPVGQPHVSYGAESEEAKGPQLIDMKANADQAFKAVVGPERFALAQQASEPVDNEDEDEYDEESDQEIDESTREVIKIVNVHKTYLLGIEGVPALRGVNLTVQDGEFISILGTSGGGKTTLLNIIGTIDKPSKGDVYICGLRIKFSTADTLLASIRLNKLGFVFQTFNLIGSLTALENVELPMQLQGKLSREEIRNRARQLLQDVGLEQRMDHFPNQLSGGEQQRVTIARSIANKPRILLLDEPTGDLDTRSTDIVMKILIDLNMREKITMIMVTHDVGLKQFAHRVVKMADGKVNTIKPVPAATRDEVIRNLNARVEAIHSGDFQDQLMIREGINTPVEQQETRIPENYRAAFDVTTTSKTSVRRPRDYPVLRDRFEQQKLH